MAPETVEPSRGPGLLRFDDVLSWIWYALEPAFETVKVAWTTSVPPARRSTAAVITWLPSGTVLVLNAFGAPFGVPPAKSHGALFSIWRGEPSICGSSR
jgi:hypothetical protein